MRLTINKLTFAFVDNEQQLSIYCINIIIYYNITLYVNPIPQIPIVKLLIVNVHFSKTE